MFKNLNLRFLKVSQDLSQEGDLQKVMERKLRSVEVVKLAFNTQHTEKSH